MHFFYDGQGRPGLVTYNGSDYYYMYNLQGEVVGLVGPSNQLVVEYRYDPWGKPLACTGSMAATLGVDNPFRYRGYVYDVETEFYYLRSRYYNPTWRRFLNADELLNMRQGVIGCNVFAYCLNNPTNLSDIDGLLPFFAIAGVIGAIIGAVVGGTVAASRGESILAGAAIGAGVGTLSGLGLGAGAAALLGGSAAATTSSVIAGANALANTVATGGIAAGANHLANNLSQATNSSSQTITQTYQATQKYYYQVTSYEGARQIRETGVLIPSSMEGSVCVLDFQPTLEQARQLGAYAYDTVVRFTTNCTTLVIPDHSVPFSGAWRNLIDGVVRVFNVIEVGFRK